MTSNDHVNAQAEEDDNLTVRQSADETTTTREHAAKTPSPVYGDVDSDLLAQYSPLRRPLVDALLSADVIAAIAPALAGTLRSSVDFYHGNEDDYRTLGNHRLGGLPDLPADEPYPCTNVAEDNMLEYDDCWQEDENGEDACIFPWDETAQAYIVPLEFVAQLDCRTLAPLQDYLPREGTLFFFLDCGSSPLQSGGKVIYVQDSTSLCRGARFADLAFNHEKTLGQKSAFTLYPRASVTAPNFYSLSQNLHLDGMLRSSMSPEQQTALDDEVYDDALCSLGFPEYYAWQLRQLGTFNVLPGSYASEQQIAWMIDREMLPANFSRDQPLPEYQGIARVNGCGFSQHALPELQAARKLGGEASDWLVLFQVCLDGQFQWENGRLNFVIHRSDLAAQRFERVFMVCDG